MLAKTLAVLYVIAVILCALSGAKVGIGFLAAGAALITLPYFLFMFLRGIAISVVVTAGLTLVAVIAPPLAIVPAIWVVIALIWKFGTLFRNLLPMSIGVALYGLLLAIPRIAALAPVISPAHAGLVLTLLVILLAAAALALVAAISRMLANRGYDPSRSTALMFGSPVYLAFFILTFFAPGPDSGHADADPTWF